MTQNETNSDRAHIMSMLNCSVDDKMNLGSFTTTANTTIASSANTASLSGTLGLASDVTSSGTTNLLYQTTTDGLTCWKYWQDYYYPQIIRESYPVYIQERARDKGKQAFEIIKMLKDKRFVKLETVGDFIDCMDALIKIL